MSAVLVSQVLHLYYDSAQVGGEAFLPYHLLLNAK